MRSVNLQIQLFASEAERSASEAVLCLLLEALTRSNEIWLRMHPSTPSIYDAGIRYVREPYGVEEWQGIAALMISKIGDCEDLACARVAEYRCRGIAARAVFTWRRIGALSMYHIIVALPDGTTEDPSRRLGMGADAPEMRA